MSQKPFEFEKSLAELETITAWFESADADLDQGIAKFERGMELAQALRNHLANVENRVEKIRQRFTAAPTPTALAEPADTENTEDDQAGLF